LRILRLFAANNEAEIERAFKFNTILQLKKEGLLFEIWNL